MRTVESVGATRSTCSSTTSRERLLPINCSNLRGLWFWSSDPNVSKAPTCAAIKNLLGGRVHFPSGSNSPELLEHYRGEFHRRTVLTGTPPRPLSTPANAFF